MAAQSEPDEFRRVASKSLSSSTYAILERHLIGSSLSLLLNDPDISRIDSFLFKLGSDKILE